MTMPTPLLPVALTLSLLFALAACDSGPGPDQAVRGFMDNIKTANFTAVKTYMVEGEASKGVDDVIAFMNQPEAQAFNGLLKAMFPKINYEILSTKVNGDAANVLVKVTFPDLSKVDTTKILADIASKAMANGGDTEKTAELLTEAFTKVINDPNLPTQTTESDVPLTKIDGAWKIASAETLQNVTGN
jgi:hypothetical protein